MTDISPIEHLRARAELWADLDHVDRLVGQIRRRTAEAAIEPAFSRPHPRLTTTGDPVDELVAIDAAVVAEALSVSGNQARIEAADRVREGLGERCHLVLRAAAATLALVVALILVSVVA